MGLDFVELVASFVHVCTTPYTQVCFMLESPHVCLHIESNRICKCVCINTPVNQAFYIHVYFPEEQNLWCSRLENGSLQENMLGLWSVILKLPTSSPVILR